MPRWRTMIVPACTAWPSPALMPSRWPTLSRPFLELEPAFLCAIDRSFLFLVGLLGPARLRGRCARPGPGRRLVHRPGRIGIGRSAGRWLGGRLGRCRARLRLRPTLRCLGLVGSELRGKRCVLLGLLAGCILEALTLGLAILLGLRHRARGALAVEDDVTDAHDRQLLAVALLHAPARLGPVLEADQLLAAITADDLARNRCIRDDRPPDRRGFAIGDEEHTLERDRVAGRGLATIGVELSADLDCV